MISPMNHITAAPQADKKRALASRTRLCERDC